MNILLLSNIFPPEPGGSGRWLFEIYRRFPAYDVVCVADEHASSVEFDRTHDLNMTRMPFDFPDCGVFSLSGFNRYRNAANRIAALARTNGSEAIHCGTLLPDGWIGMLAAKKCRIPYTVYLHGEETCFASQSRQLKWMGRKVMRDASRIVVNSRNTYRLIDEFWKIPLEKAAILHPGVDCVSFLPADRDLRIRDRLGWGNRPVVLTVGRLQRRKGQDTLIRAMPTLLKHHPDLLYCVVGDGGERESLRELVAELGLKNSVQFVHNCTDGMLAQCYQQCDLFALPNREIGGDIEGFGMVLLEAQACGKPVIAGKSGGTAETMQPGMTGELVDCRSHELLAESVRQLLNDSSRRKQMGRDAREWVLGKFDWEVLSREAAELFVQSSERTPSFPPLSANLS